MTTPSALRIIVGAVIIADGRVLAGERSGPPDLAGRWEFPGGLVEPGETEPQALARECLEELGVTVDIGTRIGPDAPIRPGRSLLRAYVAAPADHSQPRPFQHRQLRWLNPAGLDSVPWLPADALIVPDVKTLLGTSTRRAP